MFLPLPSLSAGGVPGAAPRLWLYSMPPTRRMFPPLLSLSAGGGLNLRHGESATRLNWAQALQHPYCGYGYYGAADGQTAERAQAHVPSDAGLQWGAFFGDVEHEAQQVRPAFVCVQVILETPSKEKQKHIQPWWRGP
jgi:hypothetical protein